MTRRYPPPRYPPRLSIATPRPPTRTRPPPVNPRQPCGFCNRVRKALGMKPL